MQAGEAVSFPPLHLSIAQARELIRSREVSAVELVEAALDRIAAGEKLNVFRTVLRDSALAQAREVDGAAGRGDPLGPLAGVPLALKDNIEVAGVRMTAGTPHLGDPVPASDAPVWERLRQAGAVLVGKLHMSEWAIGGTT
ncbi:MAG TPA: amidase, partial [Solirubrobacteraceae bacterium]